MVDVRIGNDIEFRWRVTINKETVPLEGMDLTLVLSSSRIGEQEREFTVQDTNVIVMKWFGIEQAETGKYTLTLWLNKGEEGQAVVDEVNCVRLVRNTAKIESTEPDCDNLEVQTVELETDIHISPINYAVLYKPQTLTEAEKAQARENIGVQDIEPCDIYVVDVNDAPSAEMISHTITKVITDESGRAFITFIPNPELGLNEALYQNSDGWRIIKGDDETQFDDFDTYGALFLWADEHSSPIATKDITDALELRVSNAEANINAVEAIASSKQDRLVSGTNIKTINGESVLGSGDIEIDVEGAVRYDESQSLTDDQKQQARANIGVEDEIFVAVYGVTTFTEVKEAYNAGKKILAKRSMIYFALTYIGNDEIIFTTITHNDGDIAMEGVRVNDADSWNQDFTFLAPESALATKVDKVTGKGLSTNDYTDADKAIVDGVTTALAGKQDTISDLATIRSGASAGATALQPTDIADWAKQPTKPTYTASEVDALPSSTEIPSKTSDLTNDSDYTTQTYVDGLVGNILTILTTI